MKIDSITLYKLDMPLRQPWTTAYGSDDTIRTMLVRITSGDYEGWGESSPLGGPTYSPEYCDGVYALAQKFIVPALLNRDFNTAEELNRSLGFIKGNPFAKAAFDLAFWDLASLKAGVPLWRYIGGSNATFQGGADFGFQKSIDILLEKIADKVEANYPRIKLKFGPSWELDVLQAVRSRFPDTVFHIDCNSAYSLDSLALFRQVDELNLAMIEQPLYHDDLLDHAKLQRLIRTPVCLDESLSSPRKARQALELGSCKYFNLKPARLGGLSQTLEVAKIAGEGKIPCWIGGMLESGVGRKFLAALSTLECCTYPGDVWAPSVEFFEDVLEEEMVFTADGHYTLSEEPGAGIRVCEKTLQKLCVESCSFRA